MCDVKNVSIERRKDVDGGGTLRICENFDDRMAQSF